MNRSYTLPGRGKMRSRHRLATLGIGALFSLGVALSANASSVPAVSVDGSASIGPSAADNLPGGTGTGFYSLPASVNVVWPPSEGDGFNGSAGVTVSATPAIAATAALTNDLGKPASARAGATVIYYVEATELPGYNYSDSYVPVLVNGSSKVTLSGPSGATSGTDVQMFIGPVNNVYENYLNQYFSLTNGGTSNGGFSSLLDLVPDAVYEVEMIVYASVYIPTDGTATAAAALDPTISFSPTFADANGYQLNFSAGISNIEPTPLPVALPLLASGLGVMGLLSWRRKRKARAVA
jgi:hypothetical protein